jgi:carboxypeptidase family protein
VAPSIPPSGPAPSPPGPAPQTYTLSGILRATPLNESLAGVTIEAMHDGRVVATATTDGRGFYLLTGLIAQEYVLRMRKVGYNARIGDVLVSGDTTRGLVMDRARLEGTVFDATSGFAFAPLEGAIVEIVSGSGAGQKAVTDATGHYAFSGLYGSLVVRASKAATRRKSALTVLVSSLG